MLGNDSPAALLKKAFFVNDAFTLDVENALFQQTVTMGPARFTIACLKFDNQCCFHFGSFPV